MSHCYKIQFILFLLTPDTRCISLHNVKGLTGSVTFRTNGCVENTFNGIYFVSFIMFLLLRLLILTWIS